MLSILFIPSHFAKKRNLATTYLYFNLRISEATQKTRHQFQPECHPEQSLPLLPRQGVRCHPFPYMVPFSRCTNIHTKGAKNKNCLETLCNCLPWLKNFDLIALIWATHQGGLILRLHLPQCLPNSALGDARGNFEAVSELSIKMSTMDTCLQDKIGDSETSAVYSVYQHVNQHMNTDANQIKQQLSTSNTIARFKMLQLRDTRWCHRC